ncbi:MAG: HAD family hydrolase [Deltaproteobacteria bacterium]|nr:HAD family hydrolase [Deltaproteobacteria bacterium]
MSRVYRAVVFDLFGTVVHFHGRPDPQVGWLRGPFEAHCPGADFEAFRRALIDVSRALAAERLVDHREVASAERFRRALAQLGRADPAAAEALSAAHMAEIAARTHLPDGHAAVLAALAARHRLGLVSNFDHAPTAHAVLARHGVAQHFETTLISHAFGRRKPHPAIFAAALAALDVPAEAALYVGDTHADDVVGAHAAGMDVAWISPVEPPPGALAPTHRITRLDELPALLGQP